MLPCSCHSRSGVITEAASETATDRVTMMAWWTVDWIAGEGLNPISFAILGKMSTIEDLQTATRRAMNLVTRATVDTADNHS